MSESEGCDEPSKFSNVSLTYLISGASKVKGSGGDFLDIILGGGACDVWGVLETTDATLAWCRLAVKLLHEREQVRSAVCLHCIIRCILQSLSED